MCRTARYRIVLAGAVGLLALILSSGCSSSRSHVTVQTLRQNFSPDILQWRMPLDPYLVDQVDFGIAYGLLSDGCMAGHGYHTHNPMDDLKGSSVRNSAGWRLFNVPIAQKFGYSDGLSDPPPSQKDVESFAEQAQGDSCARTVNATMRVDESTSQGISGMAWVADDQAQADPSVKAAVARWHSCMLPLGIPDMPEFPLNAATDSQRARFHPLRVDGAASPAEITEAVFDAKCMDSSGFSNAYYQASVTYQLEAMVKHQDILTRALADKKAQDAVIAQVLKANGR